MTKEKLLQGIHSMRQTFQQYGQEAQALLQALRQLNEQIRNVSNRIDGLELEASNLQRQIASIHVPAVDRDDPSGEQAREQAMAMIRMLEARRQNYLRQAALLREKRTLLLQKRRELEDKKRRLADACRERATDIKEIIVVVEAEIQNLEGQVQQPLQKISTMRFSGDAGAADQTTGSNIAWYQQAVQTMKELEQGFLSVADRLDDGDDREKVLTLTR